MWRWFTGLPRALRNQCHGPRASASGVCKEEELESCTTEESRASIWENIWSQGCRPYRRNSDVGNTRHHHRRCAVVQAANDDRIVHTRGTGKEDDNDEEKEKAKFYDTFLSKKFENYDILKWGAVVLVGIHIVKAPLWFKKIQEDLNRKKENKKNSFCIVHQISNAFPHINGSSQWKSLYPSCKALGPAKDKHNQKSSAVPKSKSVQALNVQRFTNYFSSTIFKDFESIHAKEKTESRKLSLDLSKKDEDPLEAAMTAFQCTCDQYTATGKNLLALHKASSGRLPEAVEAWTESGNLGYSKAHYNLGVCYETGKGVKKSYIKAAYHYQLAAEDDHPEAMYNLALMYTEGRGVCKDFSTGIQLMEKAAACNLAKAQTWLGVYYSGEDDEQKDMTKAVEFFQAAANQNDSEAEYFLGICYEHGWGVEENTCKSADFYFRAAEGGHDAALYNLAVFHYLGLGGLPEDKATAMTLMEKAVALGNESAVVFLEGIKDETDDSEKSSRLYMYDFAQEPVVESQPTAEIKECDCNLMQKTEPELKESGIHLSLSMPSLSEFICKHMQEWPDNLQDLNSFPKVPSQNSGLALIGGNQLLSVEYGSLKNMLQSGKKEKVQFNLGASEEDEEGHLDSLSFYQDTADWSGLGQDGDEEMEGKKHLHHFSSFVFHRHSTMPNLQIKV